MRLVRVGMTRCCMLPADPCIQYKYYVCLHERMRLTKCTQRRITVLDAQVADRDKRAQDVVSRQTQNDTLV